MSNPYTYVPVPNGSSRRTRIMRSTLRWMYVRKGRIILWSTIILMFVLAGFLFGLFYVMLIALVSPRTFGYRRNRYGRYYSIRRARTETPTRTVNINHPYGD